MSKKSSYLAFYPTMIRVLLACLAGLVWRAQLSARATSRLINTWRLCNLPFRELTNTQSTNFTKRHIFACHFRELTRTQKGNFTKWHNCARRFCEITNLICVLRVAFRNSILAKLSIFFYSKFGGMVDDNIYISKMI